MGIGRLSVCGNRFFLGKTRKYPRHEPSGQCFFQCASRGANGILFPYIVKYNEEAAFGKYRKIYNYISTEKKCETEFSKGMLEQAVRELNAQVGIPAKLSDAGVTDEYFAQMTEDAMKSGNITVNPQKTVREDILALYKEAL